MTKKRAGNITPREILFESQSLADFLFRWLTVKQRTNPSYSQRYLAMKLGYDNPSYLNEVLRGRRKANLPLIFKLKEYLCIQGLEQQYFYNLYSMDNLTDPKNRDQLKKENSLIRDYWASAVNHENTYLPVDSLIATYLTQKDSLDQPMSVTRIIEDLTPFIDQELLMQRLSFLERQGVIGFSENGIRVHNQSNQKYLTPSSSYQCLLPSLTQVIHSKKKVPSLHFLSAWLSEEDFDKAQGYITEALEKVVLLAIESDKTPHPDKDTQVYTFFHCSSPARLRDKS